MESSLQQHRLQDHGAHRGYRLQRFESGQTAQADVSSGSECKGGSSDACSGGVGGPGPLAACRRAAPRPEVAHAINLLGDADSTGSICGQIAGALYGSRWERETCVRIFICSDVLIPKGREVVSWDTK